MSLGEIIVANNLLKKSILAVALSMLPLPAKVAKASIKAPPIVSEALAAATLSLSSFPVYVSAA